MTEFWKSNARYWCKYCKISIADDRPSRDQHENGLRHKGNVDRYIKDLYKRGAQEKKDKAEEERELKRIEQLAHAAVGSAFPRSESSAPAAKKPRVAAPSNTFANYSTAASLGFVDDEPFLPPGAKRPDTGEAGEWQSVAVARPTPPPPPAEPDPELASGAAEDEEAEARPSFRAFKEKTAALDDDIYDVGEIKLKRKPGQPSTVKVEDAAAGGNSEEPKPKFRSIRWHAKAEAETETEPVPLEEAKPALDVAVEDAPIPEVVAEEEVQEVKPDPVEAAPSLFKKRKRPKA